jgi:hypothetical protein
MKRLLLVSALMMSLVSACAVAQDVDGSAKQASWKAITLTGTISLDGRTLVTDQDYTWSIINPEVLKGREGQHFVIKCKADQDKHAIHVLFMKPDGSGMKQAANLGDSAFRR